MSSTVEAYIKDIVRHMLEKQMVASKLEQSRKKYVIANWKMNLSRMDIMEYLRDIAEVNAFDEVILCPPAPYLYDVYTKLLELNPNISVGAQNVHGAEKGAYTGEISAAMLVDSGCQYTLVGHSERRAQGESDAAINQKLRHSIEKGLTPILCIGEQATDHASKRSMEVIAHQLVHALHGLPSSAAFIIAYEPVWAIGSGQTPSITDIEQVHQGIRYVLKELFNSEKAGSISVVYGGSVQATLAEQLGNVHDVDGLLVGGASLQAHTFKEIVEVFLSRELKE